MIVALEGIDGCGKATQAKLLAEYLGAEVVSFPDYSTLTGQMIRDHLTGGWEAVDVNNTFISEDGSSTLNARVLQCIMTVNRLELLPKIEDLRRRSKNVIFDRYASSALVYGGLDGLEREWLELIQAPLPRPDYYVLLDVPVSESFRRRPERRDRYERDRDFLELVRDKYRELWAERAARPRDLHHPERWITVDGVGEVREVRSRILRGILP